MKSVDIVNEVQITKKREKTYISIDTDTSKKLIDT